MILVLNDNISRLVEIILKSMNDQILLERFLKI